MYYLENYPIKEMYLVEVSFFDNNLKFSLGRIKNSLSSDKQKKSDSAEKCLVCSNCLLDIKKFIH